MAPFAKMHPTVANASSSEIPSVVVVDPAFDSYKPLASSARAGKLTLHFRSAGADALKLAKRHPVDAWLIATNLDDMSGFDFIELLRAQYQLRAQYDAERSASGMAGPKCVAMVGDRSGDPTQWQALEAGADHTVTKPITFRDLERILGMSPEERQVSLPQDHAARSFLTLPIGVGAAVVAIAVVMLS